MKYLSAVTHDFSSNTLEVVWLQNVEDDGWLISGLLMPSSATLER